ncbi:reverse transcriptase zinc-binding domain-containing protein [Tanacetum coccineum]
MLIIRDMIKPFVKYKFRNGKKVSMWFDNWSRLGPLEDIIPRRTRNEARMKDNDCVADLIHNGDWLWPNEWLINFPILNQLHVPNISHQEDSVMWIEDNTKEVEYSVSTAWKSLRDKWPNVNWCHVVWFNQCVPKHAFKIWLAIHGKLLTQDRMMKWQSERDLKCPLCKTCPDSHSHLFFDCAFSSTVWKEMKSKGRFSFDCHNLQSTVTKLAARKFKSNIWQILNKIILLATVYYIWNERNKRIFTKEIRSADDLIKDIQKCIANVLMSLSLKESGVVAMVAKLWGLYLEKGKLLLII